MTGFHLNLSLMTPGHFRHAWRLPHVDPLAYLNIDYFQRLARIAEDAKIDAVFLGDGPALRGEIEEAPGTGLDPLVLLGNLAAATEEEARHREQELYDDLPIERLTAVLTQNLGLPDGKFGPDDPITADDLPDTIPSAAFSAGFSVSTRALIAECPRTPRELVQRGAGGSGHRLLVGSAGQVADDLQSWFEAGTADGFTVMPADTAVDLENFSKLVVPILQERGLFQKEYSHPTLRGRFGLPFPNRPRPVPDEVPA